MKSMRLPLVATFVTTYFYRAGGGGHGPLAKLVPPESPTDSIEFNKEKLDCQTAHGWHVPNE